MKKLLSLALLLASAALSPSQSVSPSPWYGGVHPQAVDWTWRVCTNGGAYPSVGSVFTAGNFYAAIQTGGLVPLFKCLNVVAPDSDIAARTPLIIGSGKALWTGGGGGISINGYKASGTSLNTGVNASSVFSTANAGWSVYYWVAVPTDVIQDVGTSALGVRVSGSSTFFMSNPNSANLTYLWCFDNNNTVSALGVSDTTRQPGFYSLNRTANAVLNIYHAQSGRTFYTFANRTGADVAGPPNANFFFCGENLDGTDTVDSTRTESFMALHDGMTLLQSTNLYLAVDGLRKGGTMGIVPGFGGGFD